MTNSEYKSIEVPEVLLKAIEKRKKWNKSHGKVISFSIILLIIAIIWGIFWGFNVFNILLIFPYGICSVIGLLNNKAGETEKQVNKQLELRGMPDDHEQSNLWVNQQKIEIAGKINNICVEQIGWNKGTVFIPSDPFCLMIELYTGDLCEVEAMMAIEEEFSIKFPIDYFDEENPGDLKFKDVVEYITQNNELKYEKS